MSKGGGKRKAGRIRILKPVRIIKAHAGPGKGWWVKFRQSGYMASSDLQLRAASPSLGLTLVHHHPLDQTTTLIPNPVSG